METKRIGLNIKAIIVFIVIGLLFLVAGVFIPGVWEEVPYREIIRTVCLSIGIIFITTMVTEWFLINEFRKQVADTTEPYFERFSEEAQEAIERQLKASLELVQNAEYCGLVNILPPRRDLNRSKDLGKERGLLTLARIRESLEKTDNVKIICISGREFLWPRLTPSFYDFYDIFENKATDNTKYDVKILLADPEGYGAKIRGRKENPLEPDYIVEDVGKSCKELVLMKRRIELEGKISPLWSIKIQVYNFIPQGWVLITDDEMFMEPYHMADTKVLKNKFGISFDDGDFCCGGRVPVFVMEKRSFLYVAMVDYFKWLWVHSNENIFTPEFEDCFNVREL